MCVFSGITNLNASLAQHLHQLHGVLIYCQVEPQSIWLVFVDVALPKPYIIKMKTIELQSSINYNFRHFSFL